MIMEISDVFFKIFYNTKKGDLVIGYESNPVKQIVAILEITKEQDEERIYFKKIIVFTG